MIKKYSANSIRNNIFYALRPIIPRNIQIILRRIIAKQIRKAAADIWPIDKSAGSVPPEWHGWKGGKEFALVLAHDVDTLRGIKRCVALAERERELGFVSTFNIVPERYSIPQGTLETLKGMGFGLGVHGLKHDGKLFSSRKRFHERAVKINKYLHKWGTRGFSSPSMHHKLEWMYELDIDYSTATFDTDPFEPQPDGVGTIFPFWVDIGSGHRGFVEMPYTMAQDFTLFIILQEKDPSIWMQKLDWIARQGGLALVNTHSDYMAFDPDKGLEEYPVERYLDFLRYVKSKYGGRYWHALTRDVAAYCKKGLNRPTVHQ